MSSDVKDKVIDIVCQQLHQPKEKVTPEASFISDLGADSLDTVELVMSLEDHFEIEIPDSDAEKITTVGEAINYIDEKVKEQG